MEARLSASMVNRERFFYLLTKAKSTSGFMQKKGGYGCKKRWQRDGESLGGKGARKTKKGPFEAGSRQLNRCLCKAPDDSHDASTCPQGQEAKRLDFLGLLPDLAVQVELNGQQVDVAHVEKNSC